MLQGQANATNCQVDNLQCQVVDLETQFIKLAALEATFNHFTNEHWIPLKAVILSLHNSLCWTCRGDGEPIPDQMQSTSAPPTLSIVIPILPPCSE